MHSWLGWIILDHDSGQPSTGWTLGVLWVTVQAWWGSLSSTSPQPYASFITGGETKAQLAGGGAM